MRYGRFYLVLMVTHRCNLRCSYCYMGRQSARSMPLETGRAAIRRAIRSIRPGGVFELGFLGGVPLLEAGLVEELADYARRAADAANVELRLGLTTNGTQATGEAWRVMLRQDLDLCVSHD
ncbi:MAG: radical SAM protein, partial [Thermoguttaceae bacterium]